MISNVAQHIHEQYAEPAATQVADRLASVVQAVESYDVTAGQRPVVYGASHNESAAANSEESKSPAGMQQLKVVTGDLIDLWLFEGQKGLNFITA